MDSVFVMSQLEEMVKSPRLLGDLLVKGISLPFFKQTSYRKQLSDAFCSLIENINRFNELT